MSNTNILLFIILCIVIIFSGGLGNNTNLSVDEGVICDPNNSSKCAGVENMNLQVQLQDQFTDIIDLHLTQFLNTTNLNQNVSIDDTTINVTEPSEVSVGDMINLMENQFFYQGEVLSISGNIVTLDTPLDHNYTTNATVDIANFNLAVDGSVTPIIFEVCPNPNFDTSWDITRYTVGILDGVSMDSSRFGSIAGGLTNGMVMRKKNGRFKNVFNWKTNGEFAEHAYDIDYDDRASGSSQFFFRGRRSFAGQEKNGVSIRLNGLDNDCFQNIVQDDLSSQTTFVAVAQGHLTN